MKPIFYAPKARFRSVAGLVLVAAFIGQQALGQTCAVYKDSGPIVVKRDHQVIENLDITSKKGPAIDLNGKSYVTIRNVVIHHANGPGIRLSGAAHATIVNADILHEGGPASGPNKTPNENNIDCYNSANLVVKNVRLTRGSSGIYLDRCAGSRLSFIEGHDQRGPFPRGQLVQWDQSNNGVLQDFSNETSLRKSWPEDNVNIYHSTQIIVRRGLLDGNNAPTGDGVMVDEQSGNVLVQDVDGVRQGNSCFGVWGGGGHDITFQNTRCRDTICNSVRGVPSSKGLGWTIDPVTGKHNIKILNATYAKLCNPDNIVWDEKMLSVGQFTKRNFTARRPLRVKLCKYGDVVSIGAAPAVSVY